jgi:predicted ATPase
MAAIQSLHVESYGCIKSTSLALTPLHALIGPNDSGKSTLLRALRTVTQFAGGSFQTDPNNPEVPVGPFDPMLEIRTPSAAISVEVQNLRYRLLCQDNVAERAEDSAVVPPAVLGELGGRAWNRLGLLHTNTSSALQPLRDLLKPARFVRLDPDAMRKPSPLIREKERVSFLDERGAGLAGVYDVIRNRNLKAAGAILDDVQKLFPNVEEVGLFNISDREKVLRVILKGGREIQAPALSEGLLYYLAFAALRYLDPVGLLLIEEPENGLHPTRIGDVMRVLREISQTTQVVLATHSPLVINELQGDEVSVITRTPEEGTKARLLKDTFNYAERSKVYSNGELWLNYADGESERDLFQQPRQAT